MRRTKRKAFTLVELLVVVAVIGILFVVLLSKVDFATDKAKATGVQTDFRSFQLAFEAVAKENAGFNTFGWDEGDTNGDRIRNNVDAGDTNKNGICDNDETFTGRKVYTETWTGIYSLNNPKAGATDEEKISAVKALEAAVNKNLDPKLHITITPVDSDSDGLFDEYNVTMSNQARDPWKNQYHGHFITNASEKSTTNTSLNATPDGKDRGAFVIYSDGANGKDGSVEDIIGGKVIVSVLLADKEASSVAGTTDNNKDGKDDYSVAVVYTYENGYGEIGSSSTGFSNNQGTVNSALSGNPGAGGGAGGGGGGGAGSLPTPDLNGAVANSVSPIAYSWSELKTLANANLSEAELRDTYGIEVGDYKEVNGVKYVLVDRGEAYGGFVFMYKHGTSLVMNSTITNAGGYVSTDIGKAHVDSLYTNLADAELKSAIKKVTITCNSGDLNADGTDDNGTSTYTTDAYLFLASAKEVGFNVSGYQYAAEGTCFDLFTIYNASRTGFMSTANIHSFWWLRSANSADAYTFSAVTATGRRNDSNANVSTAVVPAFVIG